MNVYNIDVQKLRATASDAEFRRKLREMLEEGVREKLRRILGLTVHESNGEICGNDTSLDTMDQLMDDALKILKENGNTK